MPDVLGPPPSATHEWLERAAAFRRLASDRPGRVALGVGGLVAVAAGALLLLRSPAGGVPVELPRVEPTAQAPASDGPATTIAAEVVVHVAGAVARPGLVRLPAGARVADAVAAAGGLAGSADVDRVNLAASVRDGERVYVPTRGQPVPAEVTGGGEAITGESAPAVVDLNTATLDQLDALPGVGPATARAILDYRRRRGRFRSVEELLEVAGIGEAKLARLRPRVRV